MQGLWVVGVLFGLAFLMVIGVHSVLRDLFSRGPYPPYAHLYGDDADEVLSKGEDSSSAASMAPAGIANTEAGRLDDRENARGVQARGI